jgi:hypothetical protein
MITVQPIIKRLNAQSNYLSGLFYSLYAPRW